MPGLFHGHPIPLPKPRPRWPWLVLAAVILALGVLGARAARGQEYGNNVPAFAYYLRSFPTDVVPFNPFGKVGSGYQADPSVQYTGNGILTSNAGAFSFFSNYPDGTYTLTANSPQPITVNVGGMLTPISTTRTGTLTTTTFALHHDNGNILAGGAEIDTLGASASNPVTNWRVVRPGGTAGELTPLFRSYMDLGTVQRYMNGLGVNNNIAPVTAADLAPAANPFSTSYADAAHWTNENPKATKVWINLPVNAQPSYIMAAADQMVVLDKSKKIVIEYSNEIWNGAGFSQAGFIYNKSQSDPRVVHGDSFGDQGQEAGLSSYDAMQIFKTEFVAKGGDAGQLEPFLGSQGATRWFVDKAKEAITRVYGAGAVAAMYKFQGIGLYAGDNITSASSEQDLKNQIRADFTRQRGYLVDDRADAAASGLTEAIYEWSAFGFQTQGGTSAALMDQFRTDPESEQIALDIWNNIIKPGAMPGEIDMNFGLVGDTWSPQVDPRGPREYSQLAIDQIAGSVPEPSCLALLAFGAAAMLGRRRVA